jgi:hypothetical protein
VFIDKHFANAVILEEDGVRVRCSDGAAGCCVGVVAPVLADNCEVLVVPVVGETVQRPAFVCVDDIICGTGSVN